MNKRVPGSEVRVIAVPFSDEILPGDSIVDKFLSALRSAKLTMKPGDILVLKHKIISKAEGRLVELNSVRASRASQGWGKRFGVDPRVTELALSESKRVVRQQRGVLITETQHGFVCANSGVDVSNVDGGNHALLLPRNPDESARRIHHDLKRHLKIAVPVIISDSFGRPWRDGLTE